MKYILFITSFLFCCKINAQKTKTENVILITLDGMRWQEVFSGAEKRLNTKKFVGDTVQLAKKFWDENPDRRREILMPFFGVQLNNKASSMETAILAIK